MLRRSDPGGPSYGLRRVGVAGLALVAGLVIWQLGSAVLGSGGRGAGGSAGSPSPSGRSPSPATTPASVPPCSYGKAKAPNTAYSDWDLTLLDTRLRVAPSYVPPSLVSVSRAGFEGEFLVRSLLIGDLAALREAAEAAGNAIDIVAAYRSYDQQASLFDRRVEDLGIEDALRRTALPGHSEHQLGTAVDFKTQGEQDVDQQWESTPAGLWTAQNAHRFGFVQSYPRGKTAMTCYTYEPWHYRYFGREMARTIHDSGLSVREFLWNLDKGFVQP